MVAGYLSHPLLPPLWTEGVPDDTDNRCSVSLGLVPVEEKPVMAAEPPLAFLLSFLVLNAHSHTETDVRKFPKAHSDLAGVHQRTGRVGGGRTAVMGGCLERKVCR